MLVTSQVPTEERLRQTVETNPLLPEKFPDYETAKSFMEGFAKSLSRLTKKPNPTIKFDIKGRRGLGRCCSRFGEVTLRFNPLWIAANLDNPSGLADLVRHEVAHINCLGHDWEFRQFCRQLGICGIETRRNKQLKAPQPLYYWACPNCGIKKPIYNLPKRMEKKKTCSWCRGVDKSDTPRRKRSKKTMKIVSAQEAEAFPWQE